MQNKPLVATKVKLSRVSRWIIVSRDLMESEYGVHVNPLSIVDLCPNKLEVLKVLANLTKKELSYIVVSEFDIINGKPQPYKIGVKGETFLLKEALVLQK